MIDSGPLKAIEIKPKIKSSQFKSNKIIRNQTTSNRFKSIQGYEKYIIRRYTIVTVIKCINDIKISTNFDFKPQNYQNIAKSLSIKIYVARANLEKGGMIPEQSKSKALESNKSIVFKEFDTGHNIMSESTDEYFEFVSEFLNHR